MNNKEKISRNNFLKQLGFSGSALMAVYCAGSLSSCNDNNSDPAPLPASGIQVDLNDSANAALLNTNGYIIKNSVVIANAGSNNYVAATQVCSHENLKKVTFKSGEFFCTEHGARFTTTGSGLNSEAKKGLKVYKVVKNGNVLTIS